MRLFLTLVCGPGSLEDLRELWEPIKSHFDGLSVVCHAGPHSPEGRYLENEIDGGNRGYVTYLPYTGRHDLSRNTALWCGGIEQGDWVMQIDTLERVPIEFASIARTLVQAFKAQGTNTVYYYGKPILFQYHESLRYVGTPHEGLQRGDSQMRAMELSSQWPDESKVRLNVRPLKRPRDHFIKHYARYSLLPWGSNHYLLPVSGKPNASELFAQRETARMGFIALIRELGISRDVESILEYMRAPVPMDPRFVAHLQRDKVWNDVYRRYILGRDDFVDDHDWSNLVEIPLDSAGQAK